ncbi:amidohydrolase family protein [Parendozoicomonas haliclonae]|uniref:2-pyrone-4,6-dicarbaxylate hydrolase n=1 Tax=Parendozoicomonas haliclonae TaxID=1960125 RepID=A0A1X7ARR5_9GAMM|nr:amidohydrolase family protein [Parendozoicomonas haliclonae]SMA50780.1 2-pyrone-4,6-dicarbaxylate hydrolase [Parendozoicomonas haliclonae]
MKVFDSHLHIIPPGYPLYENQGYLPDYFTVDDYRVQMLRELPDYVPVGGAVVSGSFQKQDQTYLLHALKLLGDSYVGVTQLASDTEDKAILALDQAGVRAVRFNFKRGSPESLDQIREFAVRVYDLAGWHCEFYIDSTDLEELSPLLLSLPAVSIDHLGLSRMGLGLLLKLAEQGVRVKATGFGRLDFDPVPVIRQLYTANPECLMFGSDLPSTRAARPFSGKDIAIIYEAVGDLGAHNVLYGNALNFYAKT